MAASRSSTRRRRPPPRSPVERASILARTSHADRDIHRQHRRTRPRAAAKLYRDISPDLPAPRPTRRIRTPSISSASIIIRRTSRYSYNSSTGLLSVTDGSHTAGFTFDNFNATLDFASDGNGGTLITDPPLTESAAPSVSTSATSEGVSGSITFAAANSARAKPQASRRTARTISAAFRSTP